MYTTRNGAQIRDYSPDDTQDTMYLANGTDLSELLALAEEKWPGITPAEIEVTAEHVHTRCLGYDLYDSGDYTDYVVVTATEEYFVRIAAKTAKINFIHAAAEAAKIH